MKQPSGVSYATRCDAMLYSGTAARLPPSRAQMSLSSRRVFPFSLLLHTRKQCRARKELRRNDVPLPTDHAGLSHTVNGRTG